MDNSFATTSGAHKDATWIKWAGGKGGEITQYFPKRGSPKENYLNEWPCIENLSYSLMIAKEAAD